MKEACLFLICTFLSTCFFADEKADKNKLHDDVLLVLEKANKIEILSLDPMRIKDKEKTKDSFHGYPILGRTEVKEEVQKKVLNSLLEGMVGKIDMAKCFNPRHGIHAEYDGKAVDLVICFECNQIGVYEATSTNLKFFAISKTPKPVFDKILEDAGITKAKK